MLFASKLSYQQFWKQLNMCDFAFKFMWYNLYK